MKFRQMLAAVCIIVVIPALWIAHAQGALTLPGEVIGATIMAWGTIVTFYFERKE